MGLTPQQPVTVGNILVEPAVQSPNFSIANQTGWAIMQDGTAYFFNITAAGTITGATLVVDGAGSGVFLYSGMPSKGNLIGSLTEGAGTDPYGNTYTPGLALGIGNNTEMQLRPDLGAILIYGD